MLLKVKINGFTFSGLNGFIIEEYNYLWIIIIPEKKKTDKELNE